MPTQKIASTTLYYLSFIVLGLVHASLGPTLPYLAESTGSTLKAISILFTLRSLGYLFASLGGSRFYDKIRGHLILCITLFGLSIVLGAVPLIHSLWPLALLMLLIGFTEGMLDVGGNTLVVWTHKNNVGPFMNALHFFFGIGAFVIPLIVAYFQGVGNIGWTYWLLAAMVLPIAIIYLFVPSPALVKESDTISDSVGEPILNKDSTKQSSDTQTFLIVLIALFFFIYVGVEVGFGNWLYTYVIKLNIASEQMAAYLTSGFWGAFTLGRLITIPFSMTFKPQQLLWLCLGATLISIAFLFFQGTVLVGLWIGTILLGLSIAAIFPTLLAFADNHMQVTGRITGFFFTGVSLGAMSLPWLIGQFFENEHVGPQVLLRVVLICALALVILMTVISLHIKNRNSITQES